jgi:hypothetical protein
LSFTWSKMQKVPFASSSLCTKSTRVWEMMVLGQHIRCALM